MTLSGVDRLPGAAAFRSSFKGAVITADSPGYDRARRLWNADIDRRPLAVVRATDEGDVVAAVRWAREAGLPAAVRSGGHSYPGHSACDDGIVIDLALMNRVVADPGTRTVRAQGGTLLGGVDAATLAHGQVMPAGIVSHTGLAGLALGGGIGYLSRSFGLTCDQFVRLRLVTADGDVVHAAADEHPDLFWALRGGGGNFGVVTAFECSTHELGPLQTGRLYYRMSDAVDVMLEMEELARQAPREMGLTFGLAVDPAITPVAGRTGGERVLGVNVVHRGGPDDEILREVRGVGTPLGDDVAAKDFLSVQRMLDRITDHGWGWYMKSGHTRRLSRPLVEWMVQNSVECHEEISSPSVDREVYAVQQLGGAVGDVAEEDSAYSGRDAQWHVAVEVGFTTPKERARVVDWTRETWPTTRSMLDMSTSYVNLMFEDGPASLDQVYGAAKLARLREVKAAHDPDNFFRFTSNIEPAVPMR